MLWTSVTVIDDEAIERRRTIGRVASAEGHEILEVEVVRRDEMTADADGFSVKIGRAEVSVDGVHLLADDARVLATLLLTGADDVLAAAALIS